MLDLLQQECSSLREFGVYAIECVPTAQIYIGSAAGKGGIRLRLQRHISHLKNSSHISNRLQAAFDTHGETAFVCRIVEVCTNRDLCLEREQFYLDTMKPFGDLGFNKLTRAGSWLGSLHSVESKELMVKARLSRSDEWKSKHRKTVSTRAKAMWKNSQFRTKMIESQVREFALEKDGKIYTGRNVSLFARMHGLQQSHLTSLLKGSLTHHKGWTRAGSNVTPTLVQKNFRNVQT